MPVIAFHSFYAIIPVSLFLVYDFVVIKQNISIIYNYANSLIMIRIQKIIPWRGKKNLSIARNGYAQTKLSLCNLHELYFSFKFKFPGTDVKFSKFCSLRVQWCVLADSLGTYSVCVCIYKRPKHNTLTSC